MSPSEVVEWFRVAIYKRNNGEAGSYRNGKQQKTRVTMQEGREGGAASGGNNGKARKVEGTRVVGMVRVTRAVPRMRSAQVLGEAGMAVQPRAAHSKSAPR